MLNNGTKLYKVELQLNIQQLHTIQRIKLQKQTKKNDKITMSYLWDLLANFQCQNGTRNGNKNNGKEKRNNNKALYLS